MACVELTAFRTATESLDQDIIHNPRLGTKMYWRNLVPMGEFVQGQGVTRSTFTIKTTEPVDDDSLSQAVTLDGTTLQSTPACDTNYEDVSVGFYERTYGPKKRRFRGPVLCKEQFQYQFAIDDFINDYVDEMGGHNARVWEFMLRSDIMGFGDWWVDGAKTVGPNAIATAPRPYQDLSLSNLEIVAQDLINSGAGTSDEKGYVMDGPSGPIFPLYIDMMDAAQIFRANPTIREDARYASMGKDGDGDYAVWAKLGASRVIGNTRFVPTDIAPRANFTGGVFVPVTPFKSISAVGTDDVILTDAYINAPFHGAIYGHPMTMTAEVVRPKTAGLNFDPVNYNGDWEFITGGERICDPAVYDPEHEKGRHFSRIEYAPKPRKIHWSKVIWYKNCAVTGDQIFCS